jgi:hypothetical protein
LVNGTPQVSSVKEAREALAHLTRTPRGNAGPAIIQILSGLEPRALAPEAILDVAEVLRPIGEEVIVACRSGYTDRALPLDGEERGRFAHAMALSGAFEAVYQRCTDAILAASPDRQARRHLARALQRSMACVVGQMIEHYHARRSVGLAAWQRLQQRMQIARREKLDAVEVPDPLNPHGAATPLATYGCAMLLSIAQAGAMTHRSLDATLALAALFAHLVELAMLDHSEGSDVRADPQTGMAEVGIQRTGRIRVVVVGGVTHVINITKIDAALNRCIQHLAEGGSPEQIGLGFVARADLAALLPRLRRIWCGGGEIRETARRPLQERSAVAIGFQEIYRFASPQPLNIPDEFELYKPNQESVRLPRILAPNHEGNPLEFWQTLDHSASGMRAKRSQPGARLRRGQLLAVYFNSMQHEAGFALAEVRWLQQFTDSDAGGIAAGVRFLSSEVGVALARVFGLVPEHYQTVGPAFVLNRSDPIQMVLPTGWFARGRKLDLWYRGQLSSVRLTALRARGADYEIVVYELIR